MSAMSWSQNQEHRWPELLAVVASLRIIRISVSGLPGVLAIMDEAILSRQGSRLLTKAPASSGTVRGDAAEPGDLGCIRRPP